MENLYFALRHIVTLARHQARIILTRALANVSRLQRRVPSEARLLVRCKPQLGGGLLIDACDVMATKAGASQHR